MKVLDLYERASRVPLGKGAFSFAFALKAPYFLTIAPTMLELRPNHASVSIRKWWGVHNHVGIVHAIAVANGLEMAMGALAEATLPAHLRWIPKGMEVAYTAKADSDVTCIAETDPAQWTAEVGDGYDLPVRVRGVRADGTVVVEGEIRLWLTEKKRAR